MRKDRRKKKRNRQNKLKILILLSGALLSGCQIPATIPTDEPTKIEETTKQEIQEKEELITIEQNKIEFSEIEFRQGDIFIVYPRLKENQIQKSGMLTKINEKIQQDALRILEFYGVNTETDSLEVFYEVKGVTETEISILYTGYYFAEGTSYPVNLIYTSNLNLQNGTHQKLSDRAELEELVQNIIDRNYKIIGEQKQKELLEEIEREFSGYTKEELAESLEKADFSEVSYEAYPNWFSYWEEKENKRYEYLIIPVIHALGDYVILQIEK